MEEGATKEEAPKEAMEQGSPSCDDLSDVEDAELAPSYAPRAGGDDDTHSAATQVEDHEVLVVQERRRRARAKVLLELYLGERAYVQDLDLLHKVYYSPLEQCGVLDGGLLKSIFGNVSVLHEIAREVHHQLSQSLLNSQAALGVPDNKLEIEADGSILGAIQQLLHHCKLYRVYLSNQQCSRSTVYDLTRSNAQFTAALKKCESAVKADSLFLRTLLVKPVVRVQSYVRLFKTLDEHTPDNHPDKVSTGLLRDLLEDVVGGNVDGHVSFEQQQKVIAMAHATSGVPIQLMIPSRQIVRQGSLGFHRSKAGRREECLVTLFSDILLIAQAIGKSDGDTTHEYRNHIQLATLKVEYIGDVHNLSNAMELEDRVNGVHVWLSCSSVEEQFSWVGEIKKGIKLHQREQQRIKHVRQKRERERQEREQARVSELMELKKTLSVSEQKSRKRLMVDIVDLQRTAQSRVQDDLSSADEHKDKDIKVRTRKTMSLLKLRKRAVKGRSASASNPSPDEPGVDSQHLRDLVKEEERKHHLVQRKQSAAAKLGITVEEMLELQEKADREKLDVDLLQSTTNPKARELLGIQASQEEIEEEEQRLSQERARNDAEIIRDVSSTKAKKVLGMETDTRRRSVLNKLGVSEDELDELQLIAERSKTDEELLKQPVSAKAMSRLGLSDGSDDGEEEDEEKKQVLKQRRNEAQLERILHLKRQMLNEKKLNQLQEESAGTDITIPGAGDTTLDDLIEECEEAESATAEEQLSARTSENVDPLTDVTDAMCEEGDSCEDEMAANVAQAATSDATTDTDAVDESTKERALAEMEASEMQQEATRIRALQRKSGGAKPKVKSFTAKRNLE